MRSAFPTWNHYGKQFQQVCPNAISRFFSFQNILNPHRSMYERSISPDSFPHSYFLKMFGIRQMNRRTCSFIVENSMNLQKYGHASKAGLFVWGLWYCCHFIYWFRNNLLQQVCFVHVLNRPVTLHIKVWGGRLHVTLLITLWDIIFQWWSHTLHVMCMLKNQNVYVKNMIFFFKSLNLPPQTLMSWNGLSAIAHYVVSHVHTYLIPPSRPTWHLTQFIMGRGLTIP